MGLYILNLSADTADPASPHIAEDLTINDQESMVEVLVETILGFEDTFEEFDDPDGEDQSNNSFKKVVMSLHNPAEQEHLFNSSTPADIYFSDPRTALSLGYYRLDSPPPNR
ncbi:hypothetical protein ACPUEN_10590 [Algoriphagus yeomjeoni]|uniref:hypothetical protein n=1 Tax=Algoriphagus yeomjeoni TaxID=291403 RepID=UPI003CE54E30